ncbi:DUF3307 domain-containing protein [Luteolibacter algae]|uniref:DUF3307 domain-containing protein n=1 Tax=Luteolibacter algae TaxID=454151 RepID=A0ABW5DEA4_9BACT
MLSDFAAQLVSRGGFEGGFLLTLAMIMGHALGDYPLQGDFLAIGKNRHLDVTKLFGGEGGPKGFWIHALTAHSLVQAGIVWLITGSATLAVVELVIHWIIDFVRCEKWISFNVDQGLHIACKAIYAVILINAIHLPLG